MQRPQTSIATQNEFERSYRGMKKGSGEFHIIPGSARPGTPGQNVLARPPSSIAFFNQLPMGNSRLSMISSSSSAAYNTGLPLSSQMNISIMERPITQHGVAGIRPGTGKGLSMTRQIQDKRYYSGLLQLKVKELSQEIAVIMKNMENQNKERATYLHYDKRAKDLAIELTTLQGQLATYNIIVDKMTSDIGKESIVQETEVLATKNEQNSLKIESMFEERKKLVQKFSKLEKQLEDEKKTTERLIESMDTNTKGKYDELLGEEMSLKVKANGMQQELDELYKEQHYLEEEITLSSLKQEAVKLHLKIIEAEEKRDRLREEEKHRVSPQEEKEKLLQKIKQDNMDIAAAEAQLSEKKKRMQETEQKLEQLEMDVDDVESAKQIKYKELHKQEEIIEQFMATFEQNKDDETKKLHILENTIVEYLENISNILDIDINFTGSDEMSILNRLAPFQGNEYVNRDQCLERLTKENLKLQQILNELGMLEQKLKTEFTDLNKKMSNNESEFTIVNDLDGLKAKLMIKEVELIADCEQLKQEQLKYEQELQIIQYEYNEIKQRLGNNNVYIQINILENMIEKLMEEYKKVEDSICKEKERGNNSTVKKNTLNSKNSYNSMLKQSLKTIY